MFSSHKLSKYNSIKHYFFNKKGGHSLGVYKSLNCGYGSLDSNKKVKKNLDTACKKLKSKYKKLVILNQIHSNKFYFINNLKEIKKKITGDALITNQRKIILGVLTADCAPILIYDHKLNIISAIHAGWKGAFKGIIPKVISFLFKYGSKPENLIAVIGPCISQKNYEVKNDFKKKFIKQSKLNRVFFKKIKKRTYFSLNKYINSQLKSLGLKQIEIIDKNTYNSKNNFFSARRAKHNKECDYGRNISIIMIK